MHHFAYDEQGQLFAEGVALETIAAAAGTPTYVYSRATLERHYRAYDGAFAAHPHLICYSVKANSSRAILALLAKLGSGADIVSGGELVRALAAGIPAERIVMSGVGKTRDEMARALDAGILLFNVESEPELEALSEVAKEKGRTARVAFRVNPDIDPRTHPYIATGLAKSKFGVPIGDAEALADKARSLPGIELRGLDCHIGSQLTAIEPLMEALEAVLRLADTLTARGCTIDQLDLGGGLGIPYKTEAPPLPSELGARVVGRMQGRREQLLLEPGRVIVGNAGVLLARVLYVKKSGGKTFVITDAAMNDLIRPALYEAHHEIWPVLKRPGAPGVVVDVVGPVCESADAFARDRLLDRVQPGDLVAVMSAGAYGFSMASTYNSRPLAAEVIADGDRWAVIRERQRLEALMDGESIPEILR